MSEEAQKTTFRISSALKNIIGKDLITDDHIAVFELIKNSYDAGASKVDIFFGHNINKSGKPKLTITDDGEGMNLEDIKDKWLFVAYSAKKEEKSYRDMISNKRIQAGAKGIGRFSCDKLSDKLTIYTKKKEDDGTHILRVNWDDFEKNAKNEFSNVNVEYSFVESSQIKTASGTILEFPETREFWDREKLIKLHRNLAKLINPNKKYEEDDNFSIFIQAPIESEADESEKQKKQDKDVLDLVNGEVKNPLFNDLRNRTVEIHAKIFDNGKYIETELRDKGVLIYRIKEENADFLYADKKLDNIKISLLYLDKSVRAYITRRMGSKDAVAKYFGFVSLYKNGFRIYPFGELGDDSLGIDYRHSQGYKRYLPNRNLIGRIEVFDDDEEFKETSSRDGGLIKNDAYKQLQKFFFLILKKLEKYVIELNIRKNFPEVQDIDFTKEAEIKSKIAHLMSDLSGSKSIVNLEYDEEVFDVFERKSKESLQETFSNLKKTAEETGNDVLLKLAEEASKKLEEVNLARKEAEEEIDAIRKDREIQEEKEKYREMQVLRLKSMIKKDVENILNLHHVILTHAATIEIELRPFIIGDIKISNLDTDIKDRLSKISERAKTIHTIAQFVTKTRFSPEPKKKIFDICDYIKNYMENIVPDILQISNINFHWTNDKNAFFNIQAMQIEIAMILDNLISNAKKAHAKNIYIIIDDFSDNFIEIKFADDGNGILRGAGDNIFEMGYTTTDGSGLGLSHVKKLLEKIGGNIILENDEKYSTCFKIRIKKDGNQ